MSYDAEERFWVLSWSGFELLLLEILVSQENCCRMLLWACSCWWEILVGQEKLSWGMPLVVACCCWKTWWARKRAAQCCRWFVAADREFWLARKTKLGKDACRCLLLLLGTLVSQENFCRLLLLVCSCSWGILVGHEELGCGKLLVVACCCWDPCLAREPSADCRCWFVAADGKPWLAKKN